MSLELTFRLDDEGRCRMSGSAAVTANVRCHRCLRRVACPVDIAIDVTVVRSEAEAQALTPAMDALVLTESETTIEALVEDDLILGIPARVCDVAERCPYAPPLTYGAADEAADAPPTDNPFAVLEKLKRKSER